LKEQILRIKPPSREELRHYAIDMEYGQIELAKKYGVNRDTIRKWMYMYFIPNRKMSLEDKEED